MENRINEKFTNYYEIIEKLGGGTYGTVFKTKLKNKEEYRAIKIIDLADTKNQIEKNSICYEETPKKMYEKFVKSIINEIENMKICSEKNDNSAKLYEYFKSEKEVAIVMELCDCNLGEVIAQKKGKKEGFKPIEVYQIMSQLNNTFRIMRDKNIVHRDLKGENILIKYSDDSPLGFIVKLTDYGNSKKVTKESKLLTHNIGTRLTCAPEILKGKDDDEYTYKCDLWSIGIIIYELSFLSFPYNGTDCQIIDAIKKHEENKEECDADIAHFRAEADKL